MISGVDHVHLCLNFHFLQNRFYFVRSSKRVACSLHKQHRHFDGWPMIRAKFLWLTRRVKRITKKHQAFDPVITFGCDLRSDSPTHGFSANEKIIPFELLMLARDIDHCSPTRFELWLWIWSASALFRIDKIEGQRIESALRQSRCKQSHESA